DDDDEEPTSSPPSRKSKRRPYPAWFQRSLDKALSQLEKDRATLSGISQAYSSGTFWLSRQCNFFNLKHSNIHPHDLFIPAFFVWDPAAITSTGIPCPSCNVRLTRDGIVKRPRRIVDIDETFWIIGYSYACRSCKIKLRSWDERVLKKLSRPLAAEFPARLTWRSGISTRALGVVRSCIQNGMGAHQHGHVTGRGSTAVIQIAFKDQIFVLLVPACDLPRNSFVGGLELGAFAKERFLISSATISLADLTARILGQCLPKNVAERISSNWSDHDLTDSQIKYAACDAYVSLCLFNKISETVAPAPLEPSTAPGTSVILLSDDNAKVVARGVLAEPSSTGYVDGIHITPTRVVIRVNEVVVPGVIMTQHRRQPLSEFGAVPFHAVCHRSHDEPDGISLGDMLRSDLDSESPSVQQRTSSESDPDSAQLATLCLGARKLPSESFPDHKSRIEIWLRSKGLKWDDMLRYKSKWLWRHCRRTIPPPETLYPLVHDVFHTWGSLKDAKTGAPLFNAAAWQKAKNILELIRNGYVSDPPGVPLYYCIGLDAQAGGLPVYRCFRGTNMTEGGVHTHLRARLPTRSTSVRHMVACLLDFILRHNLLVGTFNSTGQKYTGHDSIWLLNEIQELEITLSHHYAESSPARLSWVNGNLYQATTEEMGIIPIPESVRIQSCMQPFVPGVDGKQKQAYLAQMQGTRKPVLPVSTIAERKLFSELMRTSPEFYSTSTSGAIRADAVKIWNRLAENTSDVYYKVCNLRFFALYQH
ncbi:hypothetical protein BDZ89DRAFT_974680, partial [Hymenopellis radicata]